MCGSEGSAGDTQACGKYLHGSELGESVDCVWEDSRPLRVHMCVCKCVSMSEAGGSVTSAVCFRKEKCLGGSIQKRASGYLEPAQVCNRVQQQLCVCV